MNKLRIYFPSLNGVRALAVFMVMVHHIEMVKSDMGLSSYALPGDFGSLGVTLFFVLSGFLITYLLFAEQQETQTINIKNFYIRRILRIWPMYYLIVIISFFFFSQYLYPEGLAQLQKHYWVKLVLNLFLLANVSHACVGKIPLGSNLWSVGTEEQFYLIWPWLVKKFKKVWLPFLLGSILILGIVRVILSQWVYEGELQGIKKIFFFVMQFLNLFRIDCMAVGALGAWILFFKKNKYLKVLFNPWVQALVWLWCIFSLYQGITYFNTLNHLVYALLFSIIIINLAGNKHTILSLEFKVLDFLGKISYGLYLYHFIAVVVILKWLTKQIHFENSGSQNIILYLSVFSFSILISFVSYRFFELPILKLKDKFTSIITGDAVK